MTEPLLEAMIGIVGARHVLTDPELTRTYERDWTGRYGASTAMVVRLANTVEVAAAVRIAVDMAPRSSRKAATPGSSAAAFLATASS